MNSESIKNLILQCDLLGPTPSLTIFKDNRYKSLKSAIMSIIGIIAIIAFSVYSIYDFFMFNNPTIIYFKDNTLTKKMTINLNDILFMFRLNEDISNDLDIELEGNLNYENGTKKQLRFEKCELGKNIDRKYEELITKFDTTSEKNHSNYYCISKTDSNITIFNDKLEGEKYIMISLFTLDPFASHSYNGKYISYVIQSDSINHFDRNNPLKKDYAFGDTKVFTNSEIIYPVIFLNYIEYETDNGVFFSSNKIYKGIEFSNQQDKMPKNYKNFIPKDSGDNNYNIINLGSRIDVIGIIFLRINGQFIERYKRIYPKLQSLIADIISTIQLILLIYEFLTNNLYSNKIRVEIIKSILKDYDDGEMKINLEKENKENKENKKVELINFDNNNKIYIKNIIFENIKPKKKIILPKISNSRENFQYSNRLITQNINKGKIINKTNNHNMLLEKMNKINFCNFLLYDFSCCCQKKSKINKIIEKCNELIDKEASFDNIIYKMLKIDNKKEQKIFENNEIKEIIKTLNET